MKKLYEFYWDCGRMGYLDGVFIAEEADVKSLIGEEVYFGEVLGKHSEIFGTIEAKDIREKIDNRDVITILSDIFEGETISGYNPFDYFDSTSDETD